MVQGDGPGPRYGHAMDLIAQRYLVTVSGNDGKSGILLHFIVTMMNCILFEDLKNWVN